VHEDDPLDSSRQGVILIYVFRSQSSAGFQVSGIQVFYLGYRIKCSGSGFRTLGLGFRVQEIGFRVKCLG
jgi:hypothetical protein